MEDFMKKIFILTLVLSGCTSFNSSQKIAESVAEPEIIENERELASENLPPAQISQYEQEFAKLFNKDSEEAALQIKNYLVRRYRIYVRAHKQIAQFDADLNATQSTPDGAKGPLSQLIESQNYRELLALRMMTEETVDKITYFYEQLQRITSENQFAPKDIMKAREIKFNIYGFLKENKKSLAILDDEAFKAIHFKFKSNYKEKIGMIQNRILENTALSHKTKNQIQKQKDLQNLLAKDNQELIKLQSESVILQQISANEKQLHADLLAQVNQETLSENDPDDIQIGNEVEQLQQLIGASQRVPNSIKTPSPNEDGNFTGREFKSGVFALTYDDGPSSIHTPKVLDNLKKYNVKASFFWLTRNLQSNLSIIQRAKSEGMSVNSHSYTHANIPKLSSAGKDKEISQAVDEAQKVLGNFKFFRLPYGSGYKDMDIRQRIAKKGLIHVLWNIDSLDWQDKDPEVILQRTLVQMKVQGRGIVLFHDVHDQSVEASKRLLDTVSKITDPKLKVTWIHMNQAIDEAGKYVN